MSWSMEKLFHFTCDECKMWWSIASTNLVLYNKVWYCPWCAHKQKHRKVD